MSNIQINFLPFINQNFSVTVYRRPIAVNESLSDNVTLYRLPNDNDLDYCNFQVASHPAIGFSEYRVDIHKYHSLVASRIYDRLLLSAKDLPNFFVDRFERISSKRIYFSLNESQKGTACIWLQPHYLHIKRVWGILIGYHFIVKDDPRTGKPFPLDKEILHSAGTLNDRGLSNPDFYLFKYGIFQQFIKTVLPVLNQQTQIAIQTEFIALPGHTLRQKEYMFGNRSTSSSPYFGLSKNPPLQQLPEGYSFQFIYREKDRDYAVQLLQGLRGQSFPSTFPGMERFFKLNFSNEIISGSQLAEYSDEEVERIIENILKRSKLVLPVLIISNEETQLYFRLKSKFTNAGIPCQVVTKELTSNQNSLKYSLGNIALQMFAKLGGKPWQMKPAGANYIIIGIGQSFNKEISTSGTLIEKIISYSILTDSSGIYKDLRVLGEGFESDDSYWENLVSNLIAIINSTDAERIAIHVPFRISKKKVLDKVALRIRPGIELSVLVINDKSNFFGFDPGNNGLVPYESTLTKVSNSEYLVWFEGLQVGNPKITKRFSNPLLIKFWFCNIPGLIDQSSYRQTLLQDCINLSGANWRGFKAKQLPVSIYYCQRIAEFISKFREYHLDHIDINNLKPWFL